MDDTTPIARLEGTVTLADGRTASFSISADGRQTWGCDTRTAGDVMDALDATADALADYLETDR